MIDLRPLRESELPKWYAHCQEVFYNDPPGYFESHYAYDPFARSEHIFVAMDGDVIAATVRLFSRTVWLRGRAVPMGGIGEVSTKDAYRRQGLAGRLMEMAIAAMEAEDIPVSILFGNQPLYERLGWRFCPAEMIRTGVESLPLLPDGCCVRPYQVEDLDTLMGMYDLYAGRFQGAVRRDETYWRQWVLPQWTPPVVLVMDGRPAAYCCVRALKREDGVIAVDEICAVPETEKLLAGFVREVALRERAETVVSLAAVLEGVAGERYDSPQYMMARLNKPFEGIADSDALALAMRPCGMFRVDHF